MGYNSNSNSRACNRITTEIPKTNDKAIQYPILYYINHFILQKCQSKVSFSSVQNSCRKFETVEINRMLLFILYYCFEQCQLVLLQLLVDGRDSNFMFQI